MIKNIDDKWYYINEKKKYLLDLTSSPCCDQEHDPNPDPNCKNIMVYVRIPELNYSDVYVSETNPIINDKDWQESLDMDITDVVGGDLE